VRSDGILIVKDQDELIGEFIKIFADSFEAAVAERNKFSISLSGGSTPKAIYRRLVDLSIDWQKVFFFFGDERCVLPDDPESNFRMANEAMLSPLNIGDEHIFRWRTELRDPEAVASDYAERIERFFAGPPCFDLCLLGLGDDAHTASLFPQTAALNETERIAVANWVPKFEKYRLTLTATAINNSREILFIAAGAGKAGAVASVIEGERRPDDFPAQLIDPPMGKVRWLIDGAAASRLTRV